MYHIAIDSNVPHPSYPPYARHYFFQRLFYRQTILPADGFTGRRCAVMSVAPDSSDAAVGNELWLVLVLAVSSCPHLPIQHTVINRFANVPHFDVATLI